MWDEVAREDAVCKSLGALLRLDADEGFLSSSGWFMLFIHWRPP